MDFKIGDVVELKSGGPRMTVCDIVGNMVRVVFFSQGTLVKIDDLHVDTLDLDE